VGIDRRSVRKVQEESQREILRSSTETQSTSTIKNSSRNNLILRHKVYLISELSTRS